MNQSRTSRAAAGPFGAPLYRLFQNRMCTFSVSVFSGGPLLGAGGSETAFQSFPITLLFRTLLLFAILLPSCRKPATANHVARRPSAPVVPSDPHIQAYVGEWGTGEDVDLLIVQNADGSATISLPPNPEWDSVVNNVRFEGSNLKFDLYMYYNGDEDFKTKGNSIGDHPYSGVCNPITLSKSDEPGTLNERIVTKDVPQGIDVVLRRHGGGR